MYQMCLVYNITNHYPLAGNQIAQIRVVFQVPSCVIQNVFPNSNSPSYLAYVEWFTPLPQSPDPNHLMYKVSRLTDGGHRHSSIIPVESIISSVHLLPCFGLATPRGWNSFSVLDLCNSFYVNPFNCQDSYLQFK